MVELIDINPFEAPRTDALEMLGAWRNDGALRNAVLKLGGAQDVESYHSPKFSLGLSKEQAENFYGNDPIAQKCCVKIPNEMRRGGFNLTGDFDVKEVLNYCRDQEIIDYFYEATVYAAIYSRGASIALQVDDGRLWSQPVDRNNIKSVSVAFAGDGYRIVPQRLSRFKQKPDWFSISALLPSEEAIEGLTEDEDSKAFQLFPANRAKEVREYEEQLSKNLLDYGLGFVHSDRVLWFPGIWTPIDLETRYDGGISRLSLFWTHYSRYQAALISTANILHRMEVLNVRRKGLNKILSAATRETEAELLKQLQTLITSLHTLGIGLSDSEQDEIEIIRRSLAGIPQAIKSFKEAAIAASGLTEIDLFGFTTVSGGLSTNDLRDRMLKAETVSSEQEAQWRKPLKEYLELIFLSKDGPTKGVVPDGWSIVFPSTLVLSPTEKAQLRNQQAQTDKIYFDMGLPAKVIIESRFGSGQWSEETTIPENFQIEDRTPKPPNPPKPDQQQTPPEEEQTEEA